MKMLLFLLSYNILNGFLIKRFQSILSYDSSLLWPRYTVSKKRLKSSLGVFGESRKNFGVNIRAPSNISIYVTHIKQSFPWTHLVFLHFLLLVFLHLLFQLISILLLFPFLFFVIIFLFVLHLFNIHIYSVCILFFLHWSHLLVSLPLINLQHQLLSCLV